MKMFRIFKTVARRNESYQKTKNNCEPKTDTPSPVFNECPGTTSKLNRNGSKENALGSRNLGITFQDNKSLEARQCGLKMCQPISFQSRLSCHRNKTTPVLLSSLLSDKLVDDNSLRSVIVLNSKKSDHFMKSKYSEPVLTRLIWECESVRTLDDYKKLCLVCDQLHSKYALRVSLGLLFLQNIQLREYVETLLMMASRSFLELAQQVYQYTTKNKSTEHEIHSYEVPKRSSQIGMSSADPYNNNTFNTERKSQQSQAQHLSRSLVALALLYLLTTVLADVSIDFSTEMSTQRSFSSSLAHLIVEGTAYYAVMYFNNKRIAQATAAAGAAISPASSYDKLDNTKEMYCAKIKSPLLEPDTVTPNNHRNFVSVGKTTTAKKQDYRHSFSTNVVPNNESACHYRNRVASAPVEVKSYVYTPSLEPHKSNNHNNCSEQSQPPIVVPVASNNNYRDNVCDEENKKQPVIQSPSVLHEGSRTSVFIPNLGDYKQLQSNQVVINKSDNNVSPLVLEKEPVFCIHEDRNCDEIPVSCNDEKREPLFHSLVNATVSPGNFSSNYHDSNSDPNNGEIMAVGIEGYDDNRVFIPNESTVFIPAPKSIVSTDPLTPVSRHYNRVMHDNVNQSCVKPTAVSETDKENPSEGDITESLSLHKETSAAAVTVLNENQQLNATDNKLTVVTNWSAVNDNILLIQRNNNEKVKDTLEPTVEATAIIENNTKNSNQATEPFKNTFEPAGIHTAETCFQSFSICEKSAFVAFRTDNGDGKDDVSCTRTTNNLHQRNLMAAEEDDEITFNKDENRRKDCSTEDVCYHGLSLKKEHATMNTQVNNISEHETSPTMSCSQQQKMPTCCNSESCHCVAGQEGFLSPKESDSMLLASPSKVPSDEDSNNRSSSHYEYQMRYLMLEKLQKSMGIFFFGSLYVDIAQVPRIEEKLLLIFEYISDPENDDHQLLLLETLCNWLEAVTHCSLIYSIIVESVPLCVALLRMLAKATYLAKIHRRSEFIPFLSLSSELQKHYSGCGGSGHHYLGEKVLFPSSVSSYMLFKSSSPATWTGEPFSFQQAMAGPPVSVSHDEGNSAVVPATQQTATADEDQNRESKRHDRHVSSIFTFWKRTKKKVSARLRRPSQYESIFVFSSRRLSQESATSTKRHLESKSVYGGNEAAATVADKLIFPKLEQLRYVSRVLLSRLASSCEQHVIHCITADEEIPSVIATVKDSKQHSEKPIRAASSARWSSSFRNSPCMQYSSHFSKKRLLNKGSLSNGEGGIISTCSSPTLVALRTCADSVLFVAKTLLNDYMQDNNNNSSSVVTTTGCALNNEDNNCDDDEGLTFEQVIMRLEHGGLALQSLTTPPRSMLVMFRFRELNRCGQCNRYCNPPQNESKSRASAAASLNMLICQNCQMMRFCSRACQRKTESFHQPICDMLRKRLWENGGSCTVTKNFM